MRVGSKGRYAVIALIDVAQNSGQGPVPLADVAERQAISLSYLEQLFAMLRRSNLVVSSRGPGGGYRLQRPANSISIGEVFRAVEETGNGQDREWPKTNGATAGLWSALDEHIRDFLEGVTVADVMAGKINGHVADDQVAGMANGLSAQAKLA
ncbi:MAG: Rrf2 family transcriptional regulator [Hyphomonadaceae bacterium]|nr:Rrf2 family transcriptional regulator [Hyphomonadaceae bacterium]